MVVFIDNRALEKPVPAVPVYVMGDDDVAEVVRIEAASYQFPWPENLIRNCLKVGYLGLVIKSDTGLKAHAFASCAAQEAHILNVCVDPEHRSKGYARVLVAHAIASVVQKGAEVIFLEVRESNAAAISLYHSMGFVEIGRRDGYYRTKSGRTKSGRTKSGRTKSDHTEATSAGTGSAKAPKSKAYRYEDALVMSRDLTIMDPVTEALGPEPDSY